MRWQQMIMDLFLRIEQELDKLTHGLTVEEMNWQPAPDCNSIGWLAWHLTRSYDRNMSELMGEEQLWIKDGWHARFGRAPDPNETGYGHTKEQVKAFQSPESRVLMEYHHVILQRIEQYINVRLSESYLDKEVYSPTLKSTRTMEVIITGQIAQGFYHAGQAGYIRGMLQGVGWYGR